MVGNISTHLKSSTTIIVNWQEEEYMSRRVWKLELSPLYALNTKMFPLSHYCLFKIMLQLQSHNDVNID